jgi:hypothetical protein
MGGIGKPEQSMLNPHGEVFPSNIFLPPDGGSSNWKQTGGLDKGIIFQKLETVLDRILSVGLKLRFF